MLLNPTALPKLTAKQARRKTIISLTPLIDVVFILLVFFMLASSLLDWKHIALSTSSSAPAAPSEATPFVVAVTPRELLLNGEPVSSQTLIEAARSRQPADSPISVQPVGDTPMQRLVVVLDVLARAELGPLNLVRDPDWQSPETPTREVDHALP